MFSTSQIVAASSRKAFDRGLALIENADLMRRRGFHEMGGECEAFAEVRSSSGIADYFHCYLALTSDCDEIIEGGCDCPASRKQHGMCKHCVALALEFKANPSAFGGYSDRLTRKTARSVRAYLDRVPDIDARQAAPGSIRLHVQLLNDFDVWSLRLKVSDDRATYVVGDIAGFARAVDGGLYKAYGKRLGFVHSLDAFEPTSRRVAHLVGELARMQPVAKRELTLSEEGVVRLLDALGSTPFAYLNVAQAQSAHWASQAPQQVPSSEGVEMSVVDADPDIELRIVRLDEGGYELMRDIDVHVAMCAGTAYVFFDAQAYRVSQSFCATAAFLRDVYQSVDDELCISDDDIGEFCKKVLPSIERSIAVSEPPELAALKPIRAAFSFYLDCERFGRSKAEFITVQAKATYGERECVVGQAADDDEEAFRDERAEEAVVTMLVELFGGEGRIPLSDEEAAGTLLYGGLAELERVGEVFTTPAFDRLFNDRSLRVQIGLSISGNLIDMDVHATDVSKEELAQILQSVQRKKRFHRLKSGAIASLEDLDARALERLSVDFGVKPADIEAGRIELPVYHAFFLDREYSDAQRNEDFEEYIYRFDSDALCDFPPPSLVTGELRPYQMDGYRWLRKLSSIGFGGILADEMGLGKSLQAIAYISEMLASGQAQRPALIVSPASLVYNWAEEFAKFAPSVSVCVIDGPRSSRAAKRATPDAQVFIASYDAVRMDAEEFSEAIYSIAVLDEAQYVKNQATKTSRAVRRLVAEHRFALTGTPVENRLSEIWSIFDFLMPGFLGTYMQFKRRFEMDILGGDEAAARRLKSLIGPFVLRRLKDDVLSELPEKQETVVSVPLEGEQAKLYLAEEQGLRESLLEARRARKAALRRKGGRASEAQAAGIKVDVLAELMRLRQVALDPSLAYEGFSGMAAKTKAILELVEQSAESGRKALVFSQFTGYLDVLKAELDARHVRYYEITGATDKRRRVEMVNAFNVDDVPVFLVSLKAGGTGLNLIGASVVIHADPWWNAAAIDQATDRAHRIGQRSMVSVYKMIAKGTIEERILKLQESKRKLAGSVIGETSLASLSAMTREDLESLLLD